jgi:hypothetical protein
VFGVHSWVAVKPPRADAYTVYEVTGWKLRWSDTAVSVRPLKVSVFVKRQQLP